MHSPCMFRQLYKKLRMLYVAKYCFAMGNHVFSLI